VNTILSIRSIYPRVSILVVDDSSPDGTQTIVEKLIKADENLFLISNSKKIGLGNAYKVAFSWAIEKNYDYMVEMDADGSHQALDLKVLFDNCVSQDLVIGSRFVYGGNTIGWSFRRKLLSRFGNYYTKFCLNLNIHDCTSGFRIFSKKALKEISFTTLKSNGYAFQIETLHRARISNLRIIEVPIKFLERSTGSSKMNLRIILEALLFVSKIGIESRIRKRHKPIL
jgi:dolichol-phosphate mannosyltransferase